MPLHLASVVTPPHLSCCHCHPGPVGLWAHRAGPGPLTFCHSVPQPRCATLSFRKVDLFMMSQNKVKLLVVAPTAVVTGPDLPDLDRPHALPCLLYSNPSQRLQPSLCLSSCPQRLFWLLD